jgi:hypothetical protein
MLPHYPAAVNGSSSYPYYSAPPNYCKQAIMMSTNSMRTVYPVDDYANSNANANVDYDHYDRDYDEGNDEEE